MNQDQQSPLLDFLDALERAVDLNTVADQVGAELMAAAEARFASFRERHPKAHPLVTGAAALEALAVGLRLAVAHFPDLQLEGDNQDAAQQLDEIPGLDNPTGQVVAGEQLPAGTGPVGHRERKAAARAAAIADQAAE